MFAESLLLIQQNPPIFYTIATVIGLCIGSFLNVAIYRIPIMLNNEWDLQIKESRGKKFLTQPEFNLFFPNSHCPHCKKNIPIWANIPAISYLILAGKSACCKKPIGTRYLLIEVVCALFTLFCAYQFGFTGQALAASVLGWGLIILIFIDIDTLLLPDIITIPLLWLGLIVNIFNTFTTPDQAIIGAVSGYLTFWSVAWIFKRLRNIEGLGQGDFKLLALLGAWLGWELLPLIILVSSLFGAIYGGVRILLKQSTFKKPIPFGPFLAFAGLIALFWGKTLLSNYMNLINM